MRKRPNRPDSSGMSVSLTYNDGEVLILSVRDGATPGRQPVELREEKCRLRFAELRMGINRFYAAKQAQSKIDRVIRVQAPPVEISAQDLAAINDELYRIEMVQTVSDVWPRSLDLTLSKMRRTP